MNSASRAFHNILIVRLSSVGDVVHALPALRALRRRFPNARITWLVDTRARSLLAGHPDLNEIIELPGRAWTRDARTPFGAARSLRAMAHLRRALRQRRFDLTLDFQGNIKSGLCTWLAGSAVRIGFGSRDTREANTWATTEQVDLRGRPLHQIDRALLLAQAAGAEPVFEPTTLGWTAADRAPTAALQASLGGAGPLVLLHPGTSAAQPHKRWPIERFAAVARTLAGADGARVAVTWGPGEEERAAAVVALAQGTAILAPATPTLPALGWMLKSADLIIGGDTGALHLAQVIGGNTVMIFGPTDPRLYHPYGHPESALYRRVPCSPCRERSCPDLVCLDGISADAVVATARRVLSRQCRTAASTVITDV